MERRFKREKRKEERCSNDVEIKKKNEEKEERERNIRMMNIEKGKSKKNEEIVIMGKEREIGWRKKRIRWGKKSKDEIVIVKKIIMFKDVNKRSRGDFWIEGKEEGS